MRQREQHDLSAAARRELEALDRALAGEPVDAEFDAVARLARDMHAQRPAPDEGFAARLDERVAKGFPRDDGAPSSSFPDRVREWFAGVRPMRVLAPAGAVATVAVIASVAVIQSGGGGDVAPTTSEQGGRDAAAPAQESVAPETSAAPPPAAAPDDAELGESSSAGNAVAPESQEFEFEVPPAGGGADRDRLAPQRSRDVERSATLDLSADADEFEDVSDGVVATVDRYDGFVLSSEETASGESSRSVFELKIPTESLNAALADLSDLAHVESRTEDALDITAQTTTARQRLTDARAEVRGLLRQLSAADSPDESAAIRSRLDVARAEAANAKAEVKRLAERANYSDVRVTVEADGEGDGEWGVEEAIDDLGDALSTAGGIALISLAIILPVALVIALIAFAWRRSVRRGRERALGD